MIHHIVGLVKAAGFPARPISRKVTGAGLGSSFGILVSYLLNVFHVSLNADWRTAISVALALIGGYLTRESPHVLGSLLASHPKQQKADAPSNTGMSQ